MKTQKSEATYVFDEAVAARLRNLAYNFTATIDELLARTRVEPLHTNDVGFEEIGFWEAHASLRERINKHTDDD